MSLVLVGRFLSERDTNNKQSLSGVISCLGLLDFEIATICDAVSTS